MCAVSSRTRPIGAQQRRSGQQESLVRTIAVINQKGGCGKTTSAINLSGLFARRGCRTLLVDMDPQAHCAAGLAIPEQRIDLDIGDAMLWDDRRPIDPARLLWRVGRNLDLAPSRMCLAGLESSRGKLVDRPDRELRLRSVIDRFQDSFEVGVIDCSPSIGLLTFNAMAAADAILVPVETSFFSLQGATKQISSVRSLCRRLGLNIPCWLVPTIHEPDSPLAKDLLAELHRRFARKVAPVAIRRDAALKEAASFGQPVFEYAPTSPGADDYAQLAEWIAGHLGVQLPEPDDRPRPASTTAQPDQTQPNARAWTEQDEPSPPRVVTVTADADAKRALARRLTQAITRADTSPDQPASAQPASAQPASPQTEHSAPGVDRLERDQISGDQRSGEQPGGDQPVVSTPDRGGVDPALAGVSSLSAASLAQLEAPFEPLTRAEDLARRAIAMSRRLKGEGAAVKLAPPPTAQPASSAKRVLGATSTRLGVLIVQPLTIGSRVCVGGVFNGWSMSATPMRRNEAQGVFEVLLDLPPGIHPYRLIVDGRWTHDTFNPRSAPNPFGELNSLAVVSDATRSLTPTRTTHDE